jgi:nucleotide-binding universal stress UspA family protein
MFRKMLVCTDLSPASDALIKCVEELRNIGMEEVVLTHVRFMSTAPGVEEILSEESSPALQGQRSYLEERGMRVSVEMPCGLPSQGIVDVAEKHDVSAILIGSHGKGILQSAALGSVSAQLLHQMRRPVLLARIALLEGGGCESVCSRMFRRLLFPTDFSETAERAMEYLGRIIKGTRCSVTVMHVREQGGADQQDSEEDVRFLLEAKARRLRMQGAAEVIPLLVHGTPAGEIVERAARGGFSLIVMGGQGKGVIEELFLGSVANQVARRAETPVLFIPALR